MLRRDTPVEYLQRPLKFALPQWGRFTLTQPVETLSSTT
jgi:hypothetical protein